jgi:hypothetical protein
MGAVCTTDRKCVAPRACSELVALSPRPPSGVFRVDPGGGADGGAGAFDAYCELDSNENGGGWTLLLKMDGASTRLEYASPLWTNADTYNADKPQLDVVEAKLAGFSTMPVSSIRIGMLDLGTRRWIVAPVSAPSLQALFSGPYVATSLGRAAWRSLVASPSTQKNCNVEGFNATSGNLRPVRIGIVFNNEDECASIDSYIGVGSAFPDNTAGNAATSSGNDNGMLNTKVVAYLMIR